MQQMRREKSPVRTWTVCVSQSVGAALSFYSTFGKNTKPPFLLDRVASKANQRVNADDLTSALGTVAGGSGSRLGTLACRRGSPSHFK